MYAGRTADNDQVHGNVSQELVEIYVRDAVSLNESCQLVRIASVNRRDGQSGNGQRSADVSFSDVSAASGAHVHHSVRVPRISATRLSCLPSFAAWILREFRRLASGSQGSLRGGSHLA